MKFRYLKMKFFKQWSPKNGQVYRALFDRSYYKSKYGIVRPDTLRHYLTTGWKRGFDPSAYFNTSWYLDNNPDVAAERISPLEHYVEYGINEGRLPSPIFNKELLKEFENNSNNLPAVVEYILNWKKHNIVPSSYFDRDYYLAQKELKGSVVEPIKHHLSKQEGRFLNPHPLFDTKYYLKENKDVLSSGMNAVLHFAVFGEAEGRNPNCIFETNHVATQLFTLGFPQVKPLFAQYAKLERRGNITPSIRFNPKQYLNENSDVSASNLGALEHYLNFGRNERSPLTAMDVEVDGLNELDCGEGSNQDLADVKVLGKPSNFNLSVVIPTYNRVETLQRTLTKCFHLTDINNIEFVIVNDGSIDGTRQYLDGLASEREQVIVKHVENGGPGIARNIGASLSSGDIVLFMGDDIAPTDKNFFSAHVLFHRNVSSLGAAMLGKVIWPGNNLDAPGFSVNAVMRAIQGNGGEQFGYADMAPYTWYDWKFFYTANVSLKKAAIEDWLTDGFSPAFKMVNYEDGELAYRLSRKLGNGTEGFHIYYNPLSCGTHEHLYSVDKFVERQQRAGAMAQTFLELHPDVSKDLGLDSILKVVQSKKTSNVIYSDHVMMIFKGIGSWISLMEKEGTLGNSAYHEKFMHAYFRLAYQLGFLLSLREETLEIEFAYKCALDEFISSTKSVVAREHLGQLSFPK